MSDKIDNRDYEELVSAIDLAQHTIYKRYLLELDKYPLIRPTQLLLDETPEQCLRFFKLKEFTYKKGEDIHQKLSTVYNACMAMGCTLAVIIDVESPKSPANIYVGIRSSLELSGKTLKTSFEALEHGLESNFPGTKTEYVSTNTEIPKLLDGIFGDKFNKYISSVSCVASVRDNSKTENKHFVQGIERFIDTMSGNAYTAVFIAEPVSKNEQAQIRNGYEGLYSTLSSFNKSTWSYNENNSSAVMKSLSKNVSETVTDSTAHTEGNTKGLGLNLGFNASKTTGTTTSHSEGTSSSYGETNTRNKPTKLRRASNISGVAGKGAVALGVLLTSVCPPAGIAAIAVGTAAQTAGGAINRVTDGDSVSKAITTSLAESVSDSVAQSISHTLGISAGISGHYDKSKSDTDTSSTSRTTGSSSTEGTTDTTGSGRTLQIEKINKSIDEMLKRIDEQLKRSKECEDYDSYKCAAYFLSSKESSALLAANTYRSLMLGDGSSVESGAINSWGKDDAEIVSLMKEYLKRFVHPPFLMALNDYPKSQDEIRIYTPATIVSGRELPLHIGLPTKSVYGLPVLESVAFGREVQRFSKHEDDKKIKIGNVYHMRKVEENVPVELDFNSLCSHTFITGSTGTGKSNFIYKMLVQLMEENNKILVIEPAKGEYKNVLGGYPDVKVYGTNPKFTELLKINPFSFPENISVLEHIDRLVEIFNACWPMYAAMPAVLKDAIEMAYKNKGWVFSNPMYYSTNFPTFADLMRELPKVMESSMYSSDTKSDYSGALLTRVKSLTNGINGEIFCSFQEISSQKLFDENVIVDISRIGSVETKSLIMGILVMKLQEYRMCSGKMNSPLHHVTVIEEAHNLLRRTSFSQSQESSNLQGKSVEMITNAIAEMRTYGEGFIIADQAPNLLDEAVIRNTNTKIILRLPDEEDCRLAGKSIALKDEQIKELAKLPAFVAAVYQNDWIEAVLCKSEKFDDILEYEYQMKDPFVTVRKFMKKIFSMKEKISLSKEEKQYLFGWIQNLDNSDYTKELLNKALSEMKLSEEDKMDISYNLFNGNQLVHILIESSDNKLALKEMRKNIADTSAVDVDIIDIIQKYILHAINKEKQFEDISARYNYFKAIGGVM